MLLQFSVSSESEIDLSEFWEIISETFREEIRNGIEIPLTGTRAKKDGDAIWAQMQVDRSARICWELQDSIIKIASEYFNNLGIEFKILTKTGADYDPHATDFHGVDVQLRELMDERGLSILDNFMNAIFNEPEPNLSIDCTISLAESGKMWKFLEPMFTIEISPRNKKR